MARSFTSSAHRVQKTSAPASILPQATGTVSFWFNPSWSSGDSTNHCIHRVAGGGFYFDCFYHDSGNAVTFGWLKTSGGVDDDRISISDAGLFTAGTWAHWAFTWSDAADTEQVFKNGSSIASRSVSTLVTYTGSFVTPTSTIGNDAATTTDARGQIQEWTMWDRILSNDEISSLALGYSPRLFGRSMRVHLPLIGTQSPEMDVVSGVGFTVTGATQGDHKGMIRPASMFSTAPTAAGGSTNFNPNPVMWF